MGQYCGLACRHLRGGRTESIYIVTIHPMDATTTIVLVRDTFVDLGGLIVEYVIPAGLLIFGGFMLYYWTKGFLKKHFRG